MNGTAQLLLHLAQTLSHNGLHAVTAWPDSPRSTPNPVTAAVSLRACSATSPGFQNYLGERLNPQTNRWEEIYGKKLQLTFGLDLYGISAPAVQTGLDRLTSILEQFPLDGLRPLSFSAGETTCHENHLYFCPVQATFLACFYATESTDQTFLDFALKGDPLV